MVGSKWDDERPMDYAERVALLKSEVRVAAERSIEDLNDSMLGFGTTIVSKFVTALAGCPLDVAQMVCAAIVNSKDFEAVADYVAEELYE